MPKLFSRKAIVLVVAFFAYSAAIGASAFHIHISDSLPGHSQESCVICHVSRLSILQPVVPAALTPTEFVRLFRPVRKQEPSFQSPLHIALTRAPPISGSYLPRNN